MFPYFLIHIVFFAQYGLARGILRKQKTSGNFEKDQAEVMAKKLRCSPEVAEERLEKIVYKGLCKYFTKIPPCNGVVDFIKELKNKGYKIGILSDFPPEQKGNIWGIKELCDVCLGTEKTGALKPSEIPFNALVEKLNLKSDEILYVGNSHKYDVVGAHKAGLQTAWIITPMKRIFGKKSELANITFVHYSELTKIFFENTTVQKP